MVLPSIFKWMLLTDAHYLLRWWPRLNKCSFRCISGRILSLLISKELSTSPHLVWQFLLKLMSRFLKKSRYKNLSGSKLQDVDCGRGNQLFDSDIVIGDPAKKALPSWSLKPDYRKSVMLGIRAFLSISEDYLQSHLPPQNPVLRASRCLNAKRRSMESSVKAVQTLARKLKPELDVS